MLLKKFEEMYPVVINSLKHARGHGRMAHAYLLHVDDDFTFHEFPTLIGQFAACETPGEQPCEVCKTCKRLVDKTYLSLHSLAPSSRSRQIPVGETHNPEPDTVRWFEKQFFITSSLEATKKIGVIYDADCMNENAQNAFLKTLEEPPSDTFFVLVTRNPAKLLPTTRSRCQTVVLLRNQCNYAFEGHKELFNALYNLQVNGVKNLIAAEECTKIILSISKSLNDEATGRIEPLWVDRIAYAEERGNKAEVKRLKGRLEAAIRAEYLNLRQLFVSGIHTWFAMIFQATMGIPVDDLANKELLDLVPPIDFDAIGLERAESCLKHADKLLAHLATNANEELIIRNFCLQISFK